MLAPPERQGILLLGPMDVEFVGRGWRGEGGWVAVCGLGGADDALAGFDFLGGWREWVSFGLFSNSSFLSSPFFLYFL